MKRTALRALAFVALAALSATGCATSPGAIDAHKPELEMSSQARRVMMLGRWYGRAPTTDGGLREWLVERNPEGTYAVRFRTRDGDGTVTEQVEVGEWGVSGPVYFTLMKGWVVDDEFRPADPTDGYFSDAYEILHLDAESMTYRSYDTGNTFTVRRVSEAAGWPEE